MGKQFNIYKIFLLFLFISSIHPWFLWDFPIQYISVIGAVYTMILLLDGTILSLDRKKAGSVIAFFFLYMWIAKYSNVFGQIESIANWIIMTGIIALKEKFKAPLFQFITKWFSLILLASLICYVLYIIGIRLPHTTMVTGFFGTSVSNYYTFVVLDDSLRFQSIFREPGYLTMGVAPLLFLNQYNIKNKYVLIMFLAQLFSFSLAGFLVMIVGYVVTMILSNVTNKIIKITLPLFLFTIFIYATNEIFDNNLFQDLIMSRLEWKDGTIAGNNRSSDYLDMLFERTLNSSDLIITGSEYDRKLSETGVAGYKYFFVMYGLIGIFLFFWAYLRTFFTFTNKRVISYAFLLVLLLLLYQNAYPIMWTLLITLTLFSSVLEPNKKYL